MEALILAGGKAERLGDAARGRPKPLVEVGGRALAAYQVARLVASGVDRVVVACAVGQEELFEAELDGLGVAVVAVGSRSRSVGAAAFASPRLIGSSPVRCTP